MRTTCKRLFRHSDPPTLKSDTPNERLANKSKKFAFQFVGQLTSNRFQIAVGVSGHSHRERNARRIASTKLTFRFVGHSRRRSQSSGWLSRFDVSNFDSRKRSPCMSTRIPIGMVKKKIGNKRFMSGSGSGRQIVTGSDGNLNRRQQLSRVTSDRAHN